VKNNEDGNSVRPEWTREDKKEELRKEIEDVKDAAEKQREKWQEVYESMQRRFW